MNGRQLDEERIFHTARLLPTTADQAEYLDQICAGDAALRERVEALLAVHDNAQDLLKSKNADASTAIQSCSCSGCAAMSIRPLAGSRFLILSTRMTASSPTTYAPPRVRTAETSAHRGWRAEMERWLWESTNPGRSVRSPSG